MPSRLTCKRVKGWRKPEGAVYVGRPGLFGNPFPVDVYGQPVAVELHSQWLAGTLSAREMSGLSRCDRWSDPPGVSLSTLRKWVLEKLPELRGRDLMCWCREGTSCHADNLLKMANASNRIGSTSAASASRTTRRST